MVCISRYVHGNTNKFVIYRSGVSPYFTVQQRACKASSEYVGGHSARRPPPVNRAISRSAAETGGVSHFARWSLLDTNYLPPCSGGARAVKEPGHFEVRKSSSQVKSQGRREGFAWSDLSDLTQWCSKLVTQPFNGKGNCGKWEAM